MDTTDDTMSSATDANPTGNRALGLLAAHRVEPSAAAQALQDLYRAVVAVGSDRHLATVPLEVLSERLLEAAFDVSCILASLGGPGDDLEFRVVLPSDEERRWTGCVHESAHAVVGGLLLGAAAVQWISVDPPDLGPDMLGVTRLTEDWFFIQTFQRRPPEALRADIAPKALRLAATTLGGGYGVAAAFPDRLPPFGTDLAEARYLCALFAPAGEEDAAFQQAHCVAAQVVGANRAAIMAVARALAKRGRLTGEEAREVAARLLQDLGRGTADT